MVGTVGTERTMGTVRQRELRRQWALLRMMGRVSAVVCPATQNLTWILPGYPHFTAALSGAGVTRLPDK